MITAVLELNREYTHKNSKTKTVAKFPNKVDPCSGLVSMMGTAKIADRTILLDKGKIIADGKHSDLITKSDFYEEFWK